jgi:uncharacterized membrane protein
LSKTEKFGIYKRLTSTNQGYRTKDMTGIQSKYSRRTVALFWLALVAVLIGILIYLEQIALLYVLATLSLVVLLLVVGFADLERVGRGNVEGFAGKENL